jgi:signal transduction histidine kinase
LTGWLRRAWADYAERLEPAEINAATRPSVLVTVFVVCAAPSVLMATVPSLQRITGYRSPMLTVGLLAVGLAFSALNHRATSASPAARSRIGLLNLLDTTFLAAGLVTLSASAEHPADCFLALLPVLISLVWGAEIRFSWPALALAALWPTALMAGLSLHHPLRALIVAWTIPLFTIVGVMARRRHEARRAGDAEARRKLAESSRLATLGQVGTSLAHEMNQPLSAIRDLAERLRRDGTAGSADDVEALAHASSSLSRLVDQIGLLGAPQPARTEQLDPATPVEDALLLLRSQLELRGIELDWTPPERALPRLLADRARIGQVIVNLLVNARDAVDSLPPGQARSIRIELEATAGKVSLAVTDSGPGVPSELEPRLFDPFFTTKERGRGGGLGLSISREIAEAHGGTLTFEPPPGGGATFRLTMPVSG